MTAATALSPWQDCIAHCWECRTECQKVFFSHCLEEGGKHVEKDHVLILMDCIAICQTAADSMVRGSPVHAAICAAAASICEACAESCDAIDTETMRRLGAICRACAKSCHEMATGAKESIAAQLSKSLPNPLEQFHSHT